MTKKEVALITGGGTGIGFAIAKKLHSMNKTVVLTGRRKEKLLQAKKILKKRCHILEHDISQLDSIPKLVIDIENKIGPINYLINNAGMHLRKIALETTDEEWKNKLTSAEYHILREKGTDRPFTGKYDEFFEDGLYRCAGCDEELFISETKYNSGCGWPAFYESLPNKIEESEDNSFGMKRIEITCKNCGGHLGHVFNDGPKPTGLRYCINSTSLDFEPEKDND